MEKKEYCYDFIENGKCDKEDLCILAHVIIPEFDKEKFLRLYPRPKWQLSNYINIINQNNQASIMSGKVILSKCVKCGKGNKYNADDQEMNNNSKAFCSACRNSSFN